MIETLVSRIWQTLWTLLTFALLAGCATTDKFFCGTPGIKSVVSSRDGKILVFSYCDEKSSLIASMDRDTNKTNLVSLAPKGVFYERPVLSSVSDEILFIERSSKDKSVICRVSIDGTGMKKLTSGKAGTENILDLALLHSGERAYYLNSGVFRKYSPIAPKNPHNMDFYTIRTDGSEIRKLTNTNSYDLRGLTLSPDERKIYSNAFNSNAFNLGRGWGFYIIDLQSSNISKFPLMVSEPLGFLAEDLSSPPRFHLSQVSETGVVVAAFAKVTRQKGSPGSERRVQMGYGLYLIDVYGMTIQREIVYLPDYLYSPVLLSGGNKILFVRDNRGGSELWEINMDGTGLRKLPLLLPELKDN